MDLVHFMTDSVWLGLLIFMVAMVAGSVVAFLLELRKLKRPSDKGEGGEKV